MSEYNGFDNDMPERTARRIMFCADLIYEVIPAIPDRAKKVDIVQENAESHYMSTRKSKLDDPANDVLSDMPIGDGWVKSSYFKSYWSDIKDYLAATKRFYDWNKKGIYKVTDQKKIEKMHERSANSLKRQGDRLSYRAILYNEASNGNLPGVVTQILQIERSD